MKDILKTYCKVPRGFVKAKGRAEQTRCRKSDAERDDGLFWDSEASYKHSTFEAEEA